MEVSADSKKRVCLPIKSFPYPPSAYSQGWSKYSAHASISKNLLIPIFVNIGISNEGGITAIIVAKTDS
ncbi:Uncharacterised protein [BD1-7 clade bacterium]|uniref:Uncharacterized protein n=1 Tax=BD1-7 clade bacterium TaxID=2029982 RepID=A0A5S9QM18_9GAMM|nr:Uncharacterised protein [BD1-7 clade bacterium]